MMRLAGRTLLALAAVTLAAACGGIKEDPILRLSSSEALEIGKQLLEDEKFTQALQHLVHAFEVEPNSETGREGLLRAGDALFLRGGYQSFVEAEQRYRDFLNRFPTSERAAYAQFRLASALGERIEKPDRDQQTARKALTEFENVRRLYPTSEYAGQAARKIVEVRNQLAEHEFVVGSYYYRSRHPKAASDRFQGMLEQYPDYPDKDKIHAYMCLTYVQVLRRARSDAGLDAVDNLRDACEQLWSEYAGSPWIRKVPSPERIRKLRSDLPPAPPRPSRDGEEAREEARSEDGPDN